MSEAPDGYTCEYCGKVLKRESSFLKHRCKEMIRAEELRSPRGQAAYRFYTYWLNTKKRGKHNIKTFGQSKFFSAFYKFVSWSKKVKIPDREQYIRYMVLKDYHPTMWYTNEVYIEFLDWIDRKWTADDHFKQTYKTLRSISVVAECEVNEALFQLHPNEILIYVKARKLSPWVLLKMDAFKTIYKKLTPEQQLHYEQVIRPRHWGTILKDPNKADDNELIRLAVKEANL